MEDCRRMGSRVNAGLAGGLLWVLIMLSPAAAEIELLPGAAKDLDQATVNDVMTTFRQADQALQARNVAEVMALYSPQYDYHGLKHADMRKIWSGLFDEFQELSDVHHFSRLVKVGSGPKAILEVTCTGNLSGISKTGGLRVPIDSWYEEGHYLTLEGGQWRIRGNVGDQPRLMPFGTSAHPLF